MVAAYDVIVVGGGPAGLSAALVLGRCLRRTLVCDDRTYRNQTSRAVHGFLGRDGCAPMELLSDARAQLAAYPLVSVEQERVVDIRRLAGSGFAVCTAATTYTATGVLLAMGTEDRLPEIPGLSACYGVSAHVCPYCDGWENRDAAIAILGEGDKAATFAGMMQHWSRDIVLCTNGGKEPRDAAARMLHERGIPVFAQPLTRLDVDGEGHLHGIVFRDGSVLPRTALFLSTEQQPRDELLRALGCEVAEHGIICDPNGATCVAGVYVAGDVSRDVQLAIVAAAEGARAAVALDHYLRDHRH